MSFLAVIPILGQLLDKFIPDPQAKAAAQLEMLRMAQTGELAQLSAVKELALAQAATNTAEAAAGPFRGGWRPFIGWTCGMGVAYQYLLRPLAPWLVRVGGLDVPDLPALETSELMGLVTGMLGLAGLRTIEKKQGSS